MASPSIAAALGAPAPTARLPTIDSASLDLLLNAYYDYLMKSHEDTIAGREEMYQKMEATGFDIGRRLVERMTRDRDRLLEVMDVIKWICREFWMVVFRRPIDKLQTNNRGVWVLQDHEFRWARYISGAAGEENKALVLKYTVLPAGLIRGALAAFDFDVSVNVDVSNLPRAVFQIRFKSI